MKQTQVHLGTTFNTYCYHFDSMDDLEQVKKILGMFAKEGVECFRVESTISGHYLHISETAKK